MHTFASLSGAIIAVAFWAFLAVSAATGMKYDFRKRQLAMESLRAAIEHGQPLEPAVVEKLLARHGDSEAGRAQELQPHLHIGGIITPTLCRHARSSAGRRLSLGVATRMSHELRRRAIKRTALASAAAALAVALTPYVAEGSLSFATHLGAWLPAFGHALTSPAGWACSLAVAAWGMPRARGLS
jgi:hypothetical protein